MMRHSKLHYYAYYINLVVSVIESVNVLLWPCNHKLPVTEKSLVTYYSLNEYFYPSTGTKDSMILQDKGLI